MIVRATCSGLLLLFVRFFRIGSVHSRHYSVSARYREYPGIVLNSVTVQAPAKINMALRVGSPRPDGFHPLATVFCALDLRDELTASAADEFSLEIHGISLDVDEDNLVYRAARLLKERTGTDACASISIDKSIPVAGGLAGGSANAAATLVALNELWELGLSASELHDLGAELGSDVPFSLLGGLALGTSRGEELVPIRPGAFQSWVLVMDGEGLSTPAVFREYDRLHPDPHKPAPVDELVEALGSSAISDLEGLLVNDLAEPAFAMRPDIADTFRRIEHAGVATVLSGSGPTIGVLCASDNEADVLAGQLRNDGLKTVRADGPAAGAHIVRSS